MRIRLKDGKRRVLTLSYDDGVKQDKRMMEILDKYGLKCTFNLNSGIYNMEDIPPEWNRVAKEDIFKIFKGTNHEIAMHGLNHQFYQNLEKTEIIYETVEDRKNLEKDFGVIVRGMAYPYGTYNDEVVDLLDKCGVAYARTTIASEAFDFPENWLKLRPTCHHNNPRLMEFAKYFVEDKNRYNNSEMFYLWGHSYEFDNDDNWDVIEEFAKYIGGHDDIWYATNIEVYDYVQAYNNLKTSYDKSMIYNPSAIDVWVDIKDVLYYIPAGKTVSIK